MFNEPTLADSAVSEPVCAPNDTIPKISASDQRVFDRIEALKRELRIKGDKLRDVINEVKNDDRIKSYKYRGNITEVSLYLLSVFEQYDSLVITSLSRRCNTNKDTIILNILTEKFEKVKKVKMECYTKLAKYLINGSLEEDVTMHKESKLIERTPYESVLSSAPNCENNTDSHKDIDSNIERLLSIAKELRSILRSVSSGTSKNNN